MTRKIRVSNLDPGVSVADLREIFDPLKVNLHNGQATVRFKTSSDAIQAVRRWDQAEIDGRPMRVELWTELSRHSRLIQKKKMPEATRTRLMIHWEANDSKAGKSKDETLIGDDLSELNNTPGWRTMLSSRYQEEGQGPLRLTWPKKLDPTGRERHYATAEHARQASKFLRTSPETARLFESDSGSIIASNAYYASVFGSEKGTLQDASGNILIRRSKHVAVDPKWDNERWTKFIGWAKFSQWRKARAALLATGNSELMHAALRQRPSIVLSELMAIRDELLSAARFHKERLNN